MTKAVKNIGGVVITDENGNIYNASNPLPSGGGASEAHIGEVGGKNALIVASFTRPANTTAYASGQLVANNTAAVSVTPMQFNMSRAAGKGGMLRRIRLRKSSASITNASFRVHFYTAAPTLSNGDGGVWQSNLVANYVGACDVTMDKSFTDGAAGNGVPSIGSEINFTSDVYYAVIEARGAYTPISGEVFTLDLEVLQN